MSSSSVEYWSLRRSLAFLAAVFAVVLGSLLPTAVSASATTGSPVMLCSGDQITVVFDGAGNPAPDKPTPGGGMKCAACISTNLPTLPPPPQMSKPLLPPPLAAPAPVVIPSIPQPAAIRTGLRPPPTAPPIA